MKSIAQRGYRYIYSMSSLLFNKPLKIDLRYKGSKEVVRFVKENRLSNEERTVILTKQKIRRQNKYTFENILSNPIVKDYLSNKGTIKRIETNRIEFYGRNHWAKNEFDTRILDILAKNYKNKIN